MYSDKFGDVYDFVKRDIIHWLAPGRRVGHPSDVLGSQSRFRCRVREVLGYCAC